MKIIICLLVFVTSLLSQDYYRLYKIEGENVVPISIAMSKKSCEKLRRHHIRLLCIAEKAVIEEVYLDNQNKWRLH